MSINEIIIAYGPAITVLGLICTIIALIFAAVQGRSAKLHAMELEKIRGSLSTQYIGSFPGFLPQISNLISNAKSSLTIVNHVVTHGLFSDREGWMKYRSAVENILLNGCVVKMMVLSDSRRRKFMVEQFGLDESKWKLWLSKPKVKSKMSLFLKHHEPSVEVSELEQEYFFKLLDKVHKQVIEYSFSTVEFLPIEEHISISIWIVDDKQAAFTVPSTTGNYTEHGFITSDARLIAAFREITQRYEASNIKPKLGASKHA